MHEPAPSILIVEDEADLAGVILDEYDYPFVFLTTFADRTTLRNPPLWLRREALQR